MRKLTRDAGHAPAFPRPTGDTSVSDPAARVLLVDDDRRLLDGMRRQLRGSYRLHTATSAAEALERLREDAAYAVIVSDYRMPGMDGVAFLARARRLQPDAVRILLTGHPDLETAIAAVNDGAIFRFLRKPCPPDQLIDVIDAAIEQQALQRARAELLEARLRASQRSELIGQCAAGIFRELKRSLERLAWHLEHLSGTAGTLGAIEPRIEEMRGLVEEAGEAASQMLSLGMPGDGSQAGWLHVRRFLEEFRRFVSLAFPRYPAVAVNIQSDCPSTVCADAGALGQSLLKLLVHLRETRPAAGDLVIEASAARTAEGAEALKITILHLEGASAGAPVPPPDADAAAPTHNDPAIALASDTIARLGGTIRVSSKPGCSAGYVVCLPVTPPSRGTES